MILHPQKAKKEPNFIKKPNQKFPSQRPSKKAKFLQFGFKKANMATLLISGAWPAGLPEGCCSNHVKYQRKYAKNKPMPKLT